MQAASIEDLKNESDVEQKFIYPLLTNGKPFGLGIPHHMILTKANTRKLVIDKGKTAKYYFPDYLVVIGAFPFAVLEAKERGSDIASAFREARLYANELNASYDADVNPISRVVATNGDVLWAGSPTQQEPRIKTTFDDLKPYAQGISELEDFLKIEEIQSEFHALSARFKPQRYWKPRRLIGGKALQDEELAQNTFGATLSSELAHIFKPRTIEDRARIARHAYVTSTRRDRYVEPIDKLIRAAVPASVVDAKLLHDTTKPTSLLEKLGKGKSLEQEIVILIGKAGCGKTTFIDHLKEVSLPQALRESTVWVHINMNDAALDLNRIYDFLDEEVTEGVRRAYSNFDFDSLEGQKALYAVDINKYNKGRGSLFERDGERYNEGLDEILKRLEGNLHETAINYCRFAAGDRGKLVVIVLDNCDKRTRDEQLLMFQAAQWIRKQFRALVFLPLREETYDNHRNEAPLDTAVKDAVFRIEAPPFQEVLVRRVQLALDALGAAAPKTYRFQLPNSMHVEYAASEQAEFIASILASIFEHDQEVRRLVLGLSGGNLRRAFELFLEICNSGHIPESEMVKIRANGGKHIVSLRTVMNVLLRSNRRYYDGKASNLLNVFNLLESDSHPSYFVTICILNWLKDNFGRKGLSQHTGYFSVGQLVEALSRFGMTEAAVLREVNTLAISFCIVAEDFRTHDIQHETLVKLAPAGFVHLDLLQNETYWAALAEDMSYDVESTARDVAALITQPGSHLSEHTEFMNAGAAVDYLQRKRTQAIAAASIAVSEPEFGRLSDLSMAGIMIDRAAKRLRLEKWVGHDATYVSGAILNTSIARLAPFGAFCDFEPGVSGLIHQTKFPAGVFKTCSVGQNVRVKVIAPKPVTKQLDLEFVEFDA